MVVPRATLFTQHKMTEVETLEDWSDEQQAVLGEIDLIVKFAVKITITIFTKTKQSMFVTSQFVLFKYVDD